MLKPLNPYSGSYADFGVFDIETSKREDEPGREISSAKAFKFGVTIVRNETKVHYSASEMRGYLLSKENWGIRWYAHNMEYDLSALYDNVLTIPDADILFNKGRFIEVKILVSGQKKRGKHAKYVKFWDTFNLIPMKLEKIGVSFNLPKLKFSKSEIEKSSQAAIEYCIRDCEITKLIVEKYQKFCEAFNIAPRLTTSSTALAIFRTNFLKKNIWIDNNDVNFRFSYIGGRVEAIRKVMINGHHYDVNSLYPKAMCENYFPEPSKISKGIISSFDYNLRNCEGVAHVQLFSPDSHIPVLPVKHNKKIIYPVGTIIGWYNFNELRFALERGYRVMEVFEYYYASRMESPFREYIDFWYKKKSEYKKAGAAGFYDFSKRMQNGVYGKFGEYHDSGDWGSADHDPRTQQEKDSGEDIFKLYEFRETGKGFGTWHRLGDDIRNQKTEHTIFSWCSYVTSYARMILYKELEKSGLKNIYYMDTDSKFTTKFQENSDALGEMKLEHQNINAYFQAPKMYQITENIDCRDFCSYVIERSIKRNVNVLKGVKLGNNNIFQKSYKQERVIKSRGALRRGEVAGDWETITKKPSGKDTKRIWHVDGTSEPIRVDMAQEKINKQQDYENSLRKYKNPVKNSLDADLFDYEAYHDSTLTKSENKKIIKDFWKDKL